MDSRYYMLSFSMSGVKNIKKEVRLDFYKKTVDKRFDPEQYRIKAIYGENGSGKTSLITAVEIFKRLLTERAFLSNPLNQKMLDGLLNKESNEIKFVCDFLVTSSNGTITMYSYSIELEKCGPENFEIAKESLRCKNGAYYSSKYSTVYDCNHGKLVIPMLASSEAEQHAVQASANLLNLKPFAIHSAFAKAKVFGDSSESFDVRMHIIYLLLFAYHIHVSIESSDQSDIYSYLQSLDDSDMPKESAVDALDRIISSAADSIGVSTKYVQKDKIDTYMENIHKMERFIKLFRNDLKSIDIEKKENGDIYECSMLMNYGTYRVDTAFESTGINKLIRYFSYLSAASRGDIVFIDEMDSNINDIYLCKLVEYFMKYGKGQLCFTTHNTSPMSVLKKNKNSIDFLANDNKIIPWRKNGNFAPDKLYKNGMIEYLPFNIEAEDFVGILGE